MPSPNDNFTAGQILTDTECNQFPRGVMAFNTATTSDTTITVEETQITASAFTAVASRNYRITYYEPQLACNTVNQIFTLKIKNGATVLNTSKQFSTLGDTLFSTAGQCVGVQTFTAGSVTITATLTCSGGIGQAQRGATSYAFLLVEDIGPA